DYHPDAVLQFRDFLREKYHSLEALQAAYGPPHASDAGHHDEAAAPAAPPRPGSIPPPRAGGPNHETRFATVEPPKRFDAATPADLVRHLDWAEFHEHLLAGAFERFAKALTSSGLDGIPTSHNLPPGQETTPLNAARVKRVVDLVGLDYYHAAN